MNPEQDLIEIRERHPEHLGEYGGLCLLCGAIDLIEHLMDRNREVDNSKTPQE